MSDLNLRSIQLGDNADVSKNFVIKVPAVADGTLTIERENGADILTVDAAGKVTIPGNVQTLQNVLGSRSLNTTYTNSTGLPITVMATVTSTATSSIVGTVGTLNFDGSSWAGSGGSMGITMVVPAGSTYSLGVSGGVGTIVRWMELR